MSEIAASRSAIVHARSYSKQSDRFYRRIALPSNMTASRKLYTHCDYLRNSAHERDDGTLLDDEPFHLQTRCFSYEVFYYMIWLSSRFVLSLHTFLRNSVLICYRIKRSNERNQCWRRDSVRRRYSFGFLLGGLFKYVPTFILSTCINLFSRYDVNNCHNTLRYPLEA